MSGAACQKEVERLHKFFADWFTGVAKKDPEVLERECTGRFSDDFAMVNPLGTLLSKAQLVTGLNQAHKSHPDADFEIHIHNCQILQNLSKELKLVSYEEWQRTGERTTARRSTALLKLPTEEGEDIQWKYVHESWLDGKGPKEKKSDQPDSPIKQPASPGATAPATNHRTLISPRRHISEQLASFSATPLYRDSELVGMAFRGLQIQTTQGPMANEEWLDSTTQHLEGIAQYPGKTRRLTLPEICYSQSMVAIQMPSGLVLKWTALDALEDWAKAHQHIDLGSEEEYQGVRVMKSADAALWKGKQHSNQTDFHFDWTYSTPFSNSGGIWREVQSSAMNLSLLQDTSQPILYFDEIHLYEDDLHDNGVINFKIKLRIMPTCAYILSRCWLRVDNLVLRSRECRVMIDFVSQKVCRDVQWRECEWEKLAEHNLPTDVKAWKNEGNGTETAAWQALVNRLPTVKPPFPNHCALVET